MKFNLFVLPTVPGTPEERERLRPIGRNNDHFQEMIRQMRELAVIADQMGFSSFSTTEHHLHSEGFEASIAPLIFYTTLLLGPSNQVCISGSGDPDLESDSCSQETAILDHLTKDGSSQVLRAVTKIGWSNILGQHYHVTGTPMDGSAVDNHNRDVFEEMYKIIKMAWTQETIRYKENTTRSLAHSRKAFGAGLWVRRGPPNTVLRVR